MSGEIIQAGQLVEFEARNPRPGFKCLKAGDLFSLNIEVDEETWGSLRTIPDNALLTVILKWSDGDPVVEEKPVKEKKAPKEKGPYGSYWQAMFKASFQNNLDLQSMLKAKNGSDVKEALRAAFEVESLTFVSPEEFEGWLELCHLDSLVTLSRQAQIER